MLVLGAQVLLGFQLRSACDVAINNGKRQQHTENAGACLTRDQPNLGSQCRVLASLTAEEHPSSSSVAHKC